MKQIENVLIANRGEIAVRIMKTLEVMGIKSIAIFADDDSESMFVKHADIAVSLDGESLAETYLNIEQIIDIAKAHNCDAIHPGYGFLSENADFAEACFKAGIIFIGPPTEAIQLMGDKVASRNFAEKNGVPVLKGITGTIEELKANAKQLTYPVIIKASAGGGGKGMRVVYEADNLAESIESTSREANSYFGNGEVFVERFIEKPRHIEVQILGDQHGNTVHLFERECTIQRRHQKIIEEAPSATLNEQQRENITATALKLANAANYYSAGTVEFIVDEKMNFYFMEMNTRVQVEHPVTELITDIDIIEQQVLIAQGNTLSFEQSDVIIDGHAVECRIYAEDPTEDFRPSPGEISFYNAPSTEFTRVDAGLNSAQEISDAYDPMISKVVTWGETRMTAISHMQDALEEYIILGIPTNINFLQAVLHDEDFINNDISTNYCKQNRERLLQNFEEQKQSINSSIALIAAVIYELSENSSNSNETVWNEIGFFRSPSSIPIKIDDNDEIDFQINQLNTENISFTLNGESHTVELLDIDEGGISFMLDQEEFYADVYELNDRAKLITYQGFSFRVERLDVLDDTADYTSLASEGKAADTISSPIPGTVIKVLKSVGDEVKENEAVLIVEAMKMENSLTAPRDGEIEILSITEGEKVQAGKVVVTLKSEDDES